MFFPVLACALALGSPHQDSALAKKVDFETGAEPARIAIKQLAALSGVPMVADSSVAGEMLILRFNQVPVQKAMDKIAEVATAEWKKTDEGYRLIRTPGIVAAILEKARQEREVKIAAKLKSRLEEMPTFSPGYAHSLLELIQEKNNAFETRSQISWDDGGVQPSRGRGWGHDSDELRLTQKLQHNQPWGRLTTRILAALGPRYLSSLTERTVLATAPTPMQGSIPKEVADTLGIFAKEQALWHKIQPIEPDTPEIAFATNLSRGQVVLQADMLERTPTQCLIVLEPKLGSSDVLIEIHLADASAQPIGDQGAGWGSLDGGSGAQSFDADQYFLASGMIEPEQDKSGDEAKVPLSKAAQAIFDLSSREDSSKPPANIPAEAAAYIFHPDQNEPLALFPSEPILRAAEKKELDVAACVEDSSFDPSMGSSTPTSIIGSFGPDQVRDGWLTFKPSNPLEVHHENRVASGEFVRLALKDGRVTLDNLAVHSLSHKTQAEDCMGHTLLGLIREMPGLEEDIPLPFLQLYGSLSTSQRSSLIQGSYLAVGSLSEFQKGLVAAIVYSNSLGGADRPEDLPAATAALLSRFDTEEPTSLLGKGLDPGIRLTLNQEISPVIYPTMKNSEGNTVEGQEWDLANMSSHILELTSPTKKVAGNDEEPTPQVMGYRWGACRSLTMRLSLPLWHECTTQMSDTAPHGGPLLSFDQLPADLKKLIFDAVAELKKAKDDDKGDGGDPPPKR